MTLLPSEAGTLTFQDKISVLRPETAFLTSLRPYPSIVQHCPPRLQCAGRPGPLLPPRRRSVFSPEGPSVSGISTSHLLTLSSMATSRSLASHSPIRSVWVPLGSPFVPCSNLYQTTFQASEVADLPASLLHNLCLHPPGLGQHLTWSSFSGNESTLPRTDPLLLLKYIQPSPFFLVFHHLLTHL